MTASRTGGLRLVPLALATALLLALPATRSGAVPDALVAELDAARSRLAELDEAASRAVEDYNAAAVARDDANQKVEESGREIAELEARMSGHEAAASAYAAELYKRGPAQQFETALSSAGPSEAGVRIATLRRLADDRMRQVESLIADRRKLTAVRDRQARARAAATQLAEELESRKEELTGLLDAQRDEVSALQDRIEELEQAEEQARQEAEAAAAARERNAREARERAAREAATREAEAREAEARSAAPEPAEPEPEPEPDPEPEPEPEPQPESEPPPEDDGGGSSPGRTAADAGVSQVGKPYRWGGGGPDSYDCSGLTSWSWRKAGVSLPHSSRAQYAATHRISRAQLRHGDLIFFGSPIHHVAMYIGDGRVVEAPYSGKNVRISSTALGRSDITGYGRP